MSYYVFRQGLDGFFKKKKKKKKAPAPTTTVNEKQSILKDISEKKQDIARIENSLVGVQNQRQNIEDDIVSFHAKKNASILKYSALAFFCFLLYYKVGRKNEDTFKIFKSKHKI